MNPERYRKGKIFVDAQGKTCEVFASVNAAKRANRTFKYPTIPEDAGIRYGRHVTNLGRSAK